jgi:GT2 family glycosyltransferase
VSGPAVTAVVVAFHDPTGLGRLLEGLEHAELELVVVNVEADPEVEEVTRRHAGIHRPLDVNAGYAAAVNHGVASATAEVTVFMNDDLCADAETILALAAAVGPRRADVAVPCVCTGTGQVEHTIGALPTPWTLLWEWALLPDERPGWAGEFLRAQKWRNPTGPERIDAAAAVVVAVRTALVREVPLPEGYFLYWEESEWFWRLRRRSAVVEYHPGLRVRHGGGRADVRPEKSRLLARNAVRCVART